MANPQRENGFTAISNEIMEALGRTKMSGYEWRLVMILLRQTYGWNRKEVKLSLGLISKMSGIPRNNVYRSIKKLLEKRIIIRKTDKKPFTYLIQKDYDKWIYYSGSSMRASDIIGEVSPKQGTGKLSPKKEINVSPKKEINVSPKMSTLSYKERLKKLLKDNKPEYLIEFFEHENKNLAKVRLFTSSRRTKCRTMMKKTGFAEQFKFAVIIAQEIRWRDWKPDFDYLIRNDNNVVRIIEGAFDFLGKNRQGWRDAPRDGKWEYSPCPGIGGLVCHGNLEKQYRRVVIKKVVTWEIRTFCKSCGYRTDSESPGKKKSVRELVDESLKQAKGDKG